MLYLYCCEILGVNKKHRRIATYLDDDDIKEAVCIRYSSIICIDDLASDVIFDGSSGLSELKPQVRISCPNGFS
uniref:Transposase n=1 Tax=Syphacia muris TaxID=451379 RepID=A0A0N5AAW0_9BILA